MEEMLLVAAIIGGRCLVDAQRHHTGAKSAGAGRCHCAGAAYASSANSGGPGRTCRTGSGDGKVAGRLPG